MEKKLKILIAAHIKWYNAEAEYVHRLMRGILSRGHQVMLWGSEDSPLVSRARADGIPVWTEGDPGSLSPAMMSKTYRELKELLQRERFDLVNAHRSEGYPLIARAARRAGAGVVRTRADMRMPKFAAINRVFYRRWTDFVIAGNDLIREELIIRLGLPPERVRTVRMGIDPDEVKPTISQEEAQRELGIKPEDLVVGMMGRLGPVKGQEFVLAAAARVAAEVPAVKFMVLYRDVEKSDMFLPALRRSELRDRFILVGPRPRHHDLMQLARAAVIPSVGSEAHCRVALEWMALSIPVIGSRVGVIPEIVEHGATGFLVQPRYSDTLAHCLIELLQDPGRARRMGEAGRARLQDLFHERRMVEENLEVFSRLARERSSATPDPSDR